MTWIKDEVLLKRFRGMNAISHLWAGKWSKHHHCFTGLDFGSILNIRKGSLSSCRIIGAGWKFVVSITRNWRLLSTLPIVSIVQRLWHSHKTLRNQTIVTCAPFMNLKCSYRTEETCSIWPPTGEGGMMSFAFSYPTETKCWNRKQCKGLFFISLSVKRGRLS